MLSRDLSYDFFIILVILSVLIKIFKWNTVIGKNK